MKKLIVFIALVALGWHAFQKHQAARDSSAEDAPEADFLKRPTSTTAGNSAAKFTCDGRQYCSQMTSCEEATFFIQHCPDTKMDGNHDGVPCEKQWCR